MPGDRARWPAVAGRATARVKPRRRRRDFALLLLRRSLAEFFEDSCPQFAASIAYHALFSLFPLTVVVAGGASVFLNATGSRAAAVDAIARNLPLSAHGADQLKGLLQGATTNTAALGLLGFVGLVYAATGMMAALRTALNQAWDVEEARPFLKDKLIDVGLVLLVATVGLGSLALTAPRSSLRLTQGHSLAISSTPRPHQADAAHASLASTASSVRARRKRTPRSAWRQWRANRHREPADSANRMAGTRPSAPAQVAEPRQVPSSPRSAVAANPIASA